MRHFSEYVPQHFTTVKVGKKWECTTIFTFDIETTSFFVKPDGEVKGNYNSKATRMYMEKILVSLLERFSFEFTIRNCHKDMEKYLSEIEIDELDDAYTHLRKQYNKVLKENSGIGHNNL